MSLPKHLQKQTSHYMLTYNLVRLCHNTSLENVHEPWFTCHKRSSRIKFHFSFSNVLLLYTGRQNKNLQRFKDTFFPLNLENCCTCCTRRLKQQRGADAPSASKPEPQIMSGTRKRSCGPSAGKGVVRT